MPDASSELEATVPHRVIQWGTGAMGKTALREVIERPDLRLVGLIVHSARKAGLDAGEIARRDHTGVQATDSVDEVLEVPADVVLHMPRISDPYEGYVDDICRFLASGKNVISIVAYHHPAQAVRERIIAAAHVGGSTFYGTGVNPGFIFERLALTATGLCTRLESIAVNETVRSDAIADPEYVFETLGMGKRPEDLDLIDGSVARLFTAQFSEVLQNVGHRLGVSYDAIVPQHAVTLATEDLRVAAGVVREGTVAATRWRLVGQVGGHTFASIDVNWLMADGLPGYEHDEGWQIRIVGRPSLQLDLRLEDVLEPGRMTRAPQYATVGPVINAITAVCGAPAGIFEPPLFGLPKPFLPAQA